MPAGEIRLFGLERTVAISEEELDAIVVVAAVTATTDLTCDIRDQNVQMAIFIEVADRNCLWVWRRAWIPVFRCSRIDPVGPEGRINVGVRHGTLEGPVTITEEDGKGWTGRTVVADDQIRDTVRFEVSDGYEGRKDPGGNSYRCAEGAVAIAWENENGRRLIAISVRTTCRGHVRLAVTVQVGNRKIDDASPWSAKCRRRDRRLERAVAVAERYICGLQNRGRREISIRYVENHIRNSVAIDVGDSKRSHVAEIVSVVNEVVNDWGLKGAISIAQQSGEASVATSAHNQIEFSIAVEVRQDDAVGPVDGLSRIGSVARSLLECSIAVVQVDVSGQGCIVGDDHIRSAVSIEVAKGDRDRS